MYGIIYGIMARIRDLRLRIRQLKRRPANVSRRELVSLALQIGRTEARRGKEPTYVMDSRPPLTIPAHNKGIGKFTVLNILNFLDADLAYLESKGES